MGNCSPVFCFKKCQPKNFGARFRPPEGWRSPVVSTWEVWRPLCAKLGGNPATFHKHPIATSRTEPKKTIRFVFFFYLEIRVGKNGTSKNMPSNFSKRSGRPDDWSGGCELIHCSFVHRRGCDLWDSTASGFLRNQPMLNMILVGYVHPKGGKYRVQSINFQVWA